MALSIKAEEADRLARELAGLTGESMTEAVIVSLRDRLAAERERRVTMAHDLLAMGAAFRAKLADPSPVAKAEWDALTEDDTFPKTTAAQ